jgi:hypothetical protein
VAAAVLVAGLALAAWSDGALDLTGPALPLLEEHACIRPVRSSVGKDDPTPEALVKAAEGARQGLDLGLEAVAWRRVLVTAPGHEVAAARLKKLLGLLGDARALPELP